MKATDFLDGQDVSVGQTAESFLDAPPPKKKGTIASFVQDVGSALSDLPLQTKATAESALIGNDPVAVAKSPIQRQVREADAHPRDNNEYFLGLDSQGIRSGIQSIPFSFASLGAYLAGSAPTRVAATAAGAAMTGPLAPVGAVVGGVGGTIASHGAGAAASAKAAYNMDVASLHNQLYGKANQEFKTQYGRDMTPEEYGKFASDPEIQAQVFKHGAAEAGFEAAGNLITSTAFGKFLKPVIGKFGKDVTKEVVEEAAKKAGKLGFAKAAGKSLAGELATETPTQMAQKQAESAIGLSDEPAPSWLSASDWGQAFQDVAWPTLITSGVIGGGAAGVNAGLNKYQGMVMSKRVQEFANQEGILPTLPDEQLANLHTNTQTLAESRPKDKGLAGTLNAITAEINRRQPIAEPTVEDINPQTKEPFTPEEINAFRTEQATNQAQMWRDLAARQRDEEINRTMAEHEANLAKAQVGTGTIGKTVASGIDSGAVAPTQILNPQGAQGGFTPEEVAAFQQEQSARQQAMKRDLEIQRTMAAHEGDAQPNVAQPEQVAAQEGQKTGAKGQTITADVPGAQTVTAPSQGAASPIATRNAGMTVEVNGTLYPVESLKQASEMRFAARKEAERQNRVGEIPTMPVRNESGLVIGYVGMGDNVYDTPDFGPNSRKLYDAGQEAAQSATSKTEQNPPIQSETGLPPVAKTATTVAKPETVPLSVGTTPKNAEPITVRDGVVYQGNYAAVHAETGDPITVPAGANNAQIAQALRDGKVLSNKQKIFGLTGTQQAQESELASTTAPEAAPVQESAPFTKPEQAPVSEQPKQAESTEYSIAPAKYAKQRVIVSTPSKDGFKTRAGRLAAAISKDRYTHRENGYSMTRMAANRFEKLYKEGWDASFVTGELEPPNQKATDTQQGTAKTDEGNPTAVTAVPEKLSQPKPEPSKEPSKQAGSVSTQPQTVSPKAETSDTKPDISPDTKPAPQQAKGEDTPTAQYKAGERITPDKDVIEGDIVNFDGKQWMAKVKRGILIPLFPMENGKPAVSSDTVRRINLNDYEVIHTGTNYYGYGNQPQVAQVDNKPAEVDKASSPQPQKANPESAKAGEGKPEAIEDFGEKIGGARKDVWQSYKDKLDDATEVDIKAEPLSKSWPAPDYEAMLEAGADPWAVAFMHAARDEVPNKPSSTWKLSRWVEQVKLLRGFAVGLTDGTYSVERTKEELGKLSQFKNMVSRIELYQLVGHGQSLRGVRVSSGSYSIYNGVEYNPAKIIWTVEQKAKATAFSNWPRILAEGDTKEQALANFKAKYESLEINKPASKEVKFSIYSKYKVDGYFIGKKLGRNYVDLAGPFATIKETREHLRNNHDELVKKLEKVKEIPKVRRDTNEPRVGEDMRDGQDVTRAMFEETFGFRGVEFGNWVEQKKRQKDLNDAFDALMDMAAILNVPPKSLSLNGELGLAFGARGTGGIDAAAAHYERDFVVINLTKKEGAGSIGHEWFHALDNYFSRMRGEKSKMTTLALDVSLAARDSKFIANTAIRKEMIEAFGGVVRAINQTRMKARSAKLDAKRSKDYWTTGDEMAARAFESYLISKLQDQNASNDYLANIVSEETWAAAEKMGFELEESYPYPTAGEVPAIRAAFDNFFQAIQTKETDTGTALFSRATDNSDETQRDITARRLDKFVQAYLDGQVKEHDTQLLGQTPNVLQYLGAEALPLNINGRVVHKVLGDKHRHTMDADTLKQALDELYDPLMVFESKSEAGGFVVLTEATNRLGDPVIVAVHLDKMAGRVQVNNIASVHGRAGGQSEMEGWAKQGLLLYYNKERTLSPSTTSRLNNPSVVQAAKRSDASVVGKTAEVKTTAPLRQSRLQLPSVVQIAQSSGSKIATEADVVNEFGALFKRGDSTQTTHKPLADQTYAAKLNAVLAKHPGLGEKWSNAYESVELPDALSGIREAMRTAFGRTIRAVAPTAPEFDLFNGVYVGGEVYVNAAANVGFVQIAGHELYHHIERTRPDLIKWYTEQSRNYYRNRSGYRDKLNSLLKEGEKPYDAFSAERELLADFMGDSLADPAFLQQLADSNPSRFKQFVNMVRLWLTGVANKLKGLKSSEHITDVKSLQGYLTQVLNAYAEGKSIEEVQGAPQFSRNTPWHERDEPSAYMREAQLKSWYNRLAGMYEDGSLYEDGDSPSEAFDAVMKVSSPQEQSILRMLQKDDMLGFDYPHQAIRALLEEPGAYELSPQLKAAITRASSEGVRFSRAPQVDTAAFKRWFGQSRVKNMQGEPAVVYHGTPNDFAVFDKNRLGKEGHHPTSGLGFFFSQSVAVPNEFAQDGNVMPVYLKIEKPYHMGAAEAGGITSDDQARAMREDLQKEGYDGIRIAHGGIWIAFEPNQIKSAIGNNGNFDGGNNDIRFSRTSNEPIWSVPEISKMDTFLYEIQDKLIDTKRIVEAIKEQAGEIASDWNPYIKEMLYHGRAAKRTQDFLTDELEPLVMAMDKAGVTQDQLNEYLHARHAQERNRVMQERNPDREDNADLSGMSDKEARKILADAKPELQELGKMVDSIISRTRQELVDYGLEKQETVDAWGKQYKHYVPLKREGFDDTPGTGQGFSVRGSSTKEAVGSHRAVDNILANIAMQRERVITRGEKNRVALSLYGLAKQHPNKSFWKLDKPAQITQVNPETGLEEVVAGDMADYQVPKVRHIGKDGTVQERVDPNYKGRNNVVAVRIDGVDHAIIFNDQNPRAMRMAESLKNLDMDQLGALIGTIGQVTRYIASVNTQYNPVFGVTNLIRDFQTALLNLQSTPLKGQQQAVMKASVAALKGIYQDARAIRKGKHPTSAYAELWEEFQATGGQTGYRDMFRTAKDRADAIEHMLDPEWWQKTKAGKVLTLNGVLAKPEQLLFDKAGRHVFQWLSDYNQAMENAMRLAAYKVAKQNGLGKEEAAALAKNLTVNFNKKGRVATQAGALYAFFNASVQGTARIADTLTDGAKPGEYLGKTGKAIVMGGITLGAMQALLLMAAGFDDDEPPEFVRERNLIIPAPGTEKGYITIPMPLGFHILPNIGRALVEGAVYGKPLDRLADLMLTMFEAFNPVGTGASLAQTISPTVADPIVALSENKDWTGKRIYREDFSQLNPTPGFTRAKDSASVLAKGIAWGINEITGGTDYTPGRFSPTPDQIDYLIGQATGGVGREVTKTMTTAGALLSDEELPTYKIPLVGRLVGSAGGTAGVRDKFYDNLRTLNMHEAEIKGRREHGESVSDYLDAHPEARLAMMAGGVENQIRTLQKRRNQIKEAGGNTKMIDAQIANRMRQLNDRMAALKGA